MPLHNWNGIDPGWFRHFHLVWVCAISDRLNSGGLPPGLFALLEKGKPLSNESPYAPNRITIHRSLADITSVIEIVTPDVKDSSIRFAAFVERIASTLIDDVNVLAVDLFAKRSGKLRLLHDAIWQRLDFPPASAVDDRPATVVSYSAGRTPAAYIEHVDFDSNLPEMPLFLSPERYVPVPLETTYAEAWDDCPVPLREAVLRRLPPDN